MGRVTHINYYNPCLFSTPILKLDEPILDQRLLPKLLIGLVAPLGFPYRILMN